MNDPVNYIAGAMVFTIACLVVYLLVSSIRADRKREAGRRRWDADLCVCGACTRETAPRAKVRAADFIGDTPDERLTRALEWAQTQAKPPMIVMEDGVTHFRTVRVYNGVRLTTEGQR